LPSTIEQVHREFGPRGLAVLGVNIQESPDKVKAWVREKTLTMPVILDPSGAHTRAWAVTATPTAFLVGRDGTLIAKALGTKTWTGEKGRALLAALLRP
jgi:cytochrome c biogenesis protein CcmG/thiol:disulfide interchange protein DsbE